MILSWTAKNCYPKWLQNMDHILNLRERKKRIFSWKFYPSPANFTQLLVAMVVSFCMSALASCDVLVLWAWEFFWHFAAWFRCTLYLFSLMYLYLVFQGHFSMLYNICLVWFLRHFSWLFQYYLDLLASN